MATIEQARPTQQQDAARQGAQSKWRKRLKRGGALAICVIVAYHAVFIVRVWHLRNANPLTTNLIEARAKEVSAHGIMPTREQAWVGYDQISPHLVRAVIVAEDPWFHYHSGVDLMSIKKAFRKNWQAGRIVQGGSTINQQLAKNLFLSTSKSPLRKLHEAVIALEMGQILGKRRVMELYLNVIEWGDGIYGAEAAAHHYFNTSAATLNPQQAAFLAAVLPNPRAGQTPTNSTDSVRARTYAIVMHMERFQLIIDGNAGKSSK